MRCPFCAASFPETTAPGLAVVAGLAATLAGCGPQVVGEDADGTSTNGSSGSPATSTSTATTAVESTTAVSTVTSATASTTTFEDSTDETTWSTPFVDNPDGGGLYGLGCDLWNNDCPRGEKCMPWANDGGMYWNAVRCSPIARKPGQPGEPCTVEGSGYSGIDDCDVGAMCFDVDPDTLTGTCVAMCEGSPEVPSCADPTRVCSQTHESAINLCLWPCDPVAQDCPDGLSCTSDGVAFVCVRPGAGVFADSCAELLDCGPALSCVENSTAGCADRCCTEACDPMAPICPEVGQACQALDAAGVCAN